MNNEKKLNVCFYSRDCNRDIFAYLGKKLEDSKISTCYIIHDDNDHNAPEEQGCKNSSYNLTTYIENNWNNVQLLSSIDLAIIEEKYKIESLWSIFYTDRFLFHYPYDDAIKFIKLHIAFYLDIIEKEAINIFVYENISHFSAYLFFQIGKFHNVQYLGFSMPRDFTDKKFHFTNDEHSTNYKMNQYYNERTFSDQELKDAKQFIDTKRINKSLPEYMAHFGKEPQINKRFFWSLLHYGKRTLMKKNFYDYMHYREVEPLGDFKFYFKYKIHKLHYKKPIENDKYYLFPLHFQPEATTLVNAQNYEKQLCAIDLLAKKIPIDTKLYVKEHYAGLGHREMNFYSKLKKYPNVRLINPWENAMDLIEKSVGIITLTSTTGWEGIIFKKPVFLLGNMFYSSFKYINKINDINELPNQLKNHSLLGLDDESYEDELILYIASYIKSLKDGGFVAYSIADLMTKENLKDLYKSFIDEVHMIEND